MAGFTRNELTEQLLGKEIMINFISLAKAVKIYDATTGGPFRYDLQKLEYCLHLPMISSVQSRVQDSSINIDDLTWLLRTSMEFTKPFIRENEKTVIAICEFFVEQNKDYQSGEFRDFGNKRFDDLSDLINFYERQRDKGPRYIYLNELPAQHQLDFQQFLIGQTVPDDGVAYYPDFVKFVNNCKLGKPSLFFEKIR